MSRAKPTTSLSPTMFRHFAIATVVITGTLAMFADGQGREALEDTVRQNQQRTAAQQAEKVANPHGKGKLFKDAASSEAGGFSGDEGSPPSSDFAPRRSAKPQSTRSPRGRQPKATDRDHAGGYPPGLEKPKLVPAEVEQPDTTPTDRELEAILKSSRRRSGPSGDSDGPIDAY